MRNVYLIVDIFTFYHFKGCVSFDPRDESFSRIYVVHMLDELFIRMLHGVVFPRIPDHKARQSKKTIKIIPDSEAEGKEELRSPEKEK